MRRTPPSGAPSASRNGATENREGVHLGEAARAQMCDMCARDSPFPSHSRSSFSSPCRAAGWSHEVRCDLCAPRPARGSAAARRSKPPPPPPPGSCAPCPPVRADCVDGRERRGRAALKEG
eukprot:363107-Chlamydomonas_euryale.AAC.12